MSEIEFITSRFNPCRLWALTTIGILAFLWFMLIDHLRGEWSINPQYSYGWIVPFLCLGVLFLRWQRAEPSAPHDRPQIDGVRPSPEFCCPRRLLPLLVLLACLWLPTRLVQEANPEWRFISWLLAMQVIGMTLIAVHLQWGNWWARVIVVPACFFFVAVPWPTLVEGPTIQLLTRICAGLTVETASWFGVPSAQHGNVIEVGNGLVGIDEACSGIRSFQSSLMISLFLGELYRLDLIRRFLLVPFGFLVALTFNVCRTTLLTCLAARKGMNAISEYHDPAGVTIMLASAFALWGVTLLLSRKSQADQLSAVQTPSSVEGSSAIQIPGWTAALLAWLVAAEVGVRCWYRFHERALPATISWAIKWPRTNPTFCEPVMEQKARRMLRYDEAVSGAWREPDGTQWQMIYLRWLPGRIAVHLAKMHTPEACLKAAGESVQALPGLTSITIRGITLPFRRYVLNEQAGSTYVFYCLWQDRGNDRFFQTQSLTYWKRLEPIMQGQRNTGQRSLEVVIRGVSTVEEAQHALTRELGEMLIVRGKELGSQM